MSGQKIVEMIENAGILPIIRLPDLSQIIEITHALLAGEVNAVELTMTSPGAVAAVAEVRAKMPAFQNSNAIIGMGSVLNVTQAKEAVSAGAQFIVAPHTDLPTMAYCRQQNIPIMPGALTPTEIQTAWMAGAAIVKIFPARTVAATYIKDVLAPLPYLKLMPTGGVNLENAGTFIRNGAVALGVGGNLVDRQLIAAKKWAELTARTAAYVQIVQAARRVP